MTLLKKGNGNFPSFSNFFDDFFTRDWFNWPVSSSIAGTTIPRVNIQETDDDFRVEMAAPGMKREDFKVELDNNTLVISSDMDREDENIRFVRREFSYQSFRRSFYLPDTLEADKIEAKYQDGILRMVIPKKEEARKKPVKTIQIS